MSEKKGGVRFIRKGGRIIPIRSKKASKGGMSRELKIDIATGAALGAATTLFHKRTRFRAVVGLASMVLGAGTTYSRFKNRKTRARAVVDDFGGLWAKGAAGIAAAGLSRVGLGKLAKFAKKIKR